MRALRLLAERRLGRRLTHMDAADLLARYGGVDVAIDTMVAELERSRALAARAVETVRVPTAAADVVARPPRAETAALPTRTRTASRLRRVALIAGATGALVVAAGALGQVVVAASAGHGARELLIPGAALLAAGLVAATAASRRSPAMRPWREVVALALSAVAAAGVGAVGQCALRPPLGLGILLVEPALAGAIATVAGAIALSAAVSFSGRGSRGPARAGSRTPA